MFGLEDYADSFDRMHASVQKDWNKLMLEDPGRFSGSYFGPDSWVNYFTAIPNAITWPLGTFVMAQGKALVDVLRLGEGTKSGTLGGVAEDGLRILTLIPVASAGAKLVGPAARSVRILGTARVAGQLGGMSCGPTAIAVAGRVSGQATAMTLAEVGTAFGKGHPNLPTFPGMTIPEMRTTLNALSLTNTEVNLTGQGTEAVATLARQGRGPVIIAVEWWETVGGVTRPATNPQFLKPMSTIAKNLHPNGIPVPANTGHLLAVFRGITGEVMVADQFGIRPIADLGKIKGVTSPFTLVNTGFVVQDGALMSDAVSATGTKTLLSGRDWFAGAFAINMVVVNAPQVWAMDAGVQTKMGKQPRPWPGMPSSMLDSFAPRTGPSTGSNPLGGDSPLIPAPGQLPAPNVLSPTLNQDVNLLLSKMPPSPHTREFVQLGIETGLSDNRLRNALLYLVNGGILQATRWMQLNGNATPNMVRRGM